MKSKVLNLLAALLLIFGFSRCEVIPELQSELKQPVLVSPTNNAKNQSPNVDFTWKRSTGAEMYRLLVSKSVNFETYVADTLVQSTSVSFDSLEEETSYYWKVRSQTEEADGPWSDIWTFSTTSASSDIEPVTVALQSPEDGVELEPENIEFDWESASSADYHFQIATDEAFSALVRDSVVENSTISVINLDGNEDYFWRVNPIVEDAPSEWSEIRSFSTAPNSAVPAVTLTSPEDGSTDLATSINLQWEALDGVSNYQVQVATNSDFATTESDEIVGENSYTVSGLNNSQTYYWRVQAADDGNNNNWSAAYSFQVEAASGGGGGTNPPSNEGFVTARDSDFYLNGEVFRFVGTNAYYLPTYEKIDPGVVDRAMDAFQEAGVEVVRIWGFYDGPPIWSNDISIQPRPGEYNEEDLVRMDKVIAQGKEHGVRFVFTLVNYWEELGGISQYNEWDGNPDGGLQHFITDPDTKGWFKDYIEMILNRVNTQTGVAYKDEPAIFSWEIMNEGRNYSGSDPYDMRDFYQEIAQFIKSIDQNHMVTTGEDGYDNNTPSEYSVDQYSNTYVLRANKGTSFLLNIEIPEIDYGSMHWYPSGWGFGSDASDNVLRAQRAWVSDHQRIAENVGKPVVLGEYGFPGWGDSRVSTVYNDLWNHAEDIELDGSLLWQFTADYVKCYEYGGNICWPGGRADQQLYNDFVDHINTMRATN